MMAMSEKPAQRRVSIDESVKKRLRELSSEIDKICCENRVPFFFAAAVKDDGTGTEYMKVARTSLPMGVELSEDFITSYLKVSRGCEVIFPEYLSDLELPEDMMEDFM